MTIDGVGPGTWDRGPAAAPTSGCSARRVGLIIALAWSRHLPIWNFCGDKDQPATVEANRAMAAALQKAGANARYTEYPNVPHNCWDDAYGTDELHAWMLAQARSRNRP